MNNIIFSSKPIQDLVNEIADEVIRRLNHLDESKQEADKWFNIDELCNYLPDKPSKPTIYAKVSKNEIPYHKNDNEKKLRFLKSEIDEWLLQGKQKTNKEIEAEAIQKVKHGRKSNA